MNIATLKELVSSLQEASKLVCLVEAQDESLVDEVERELNLQFPESVKSFYRTYEYLQLGVKEFIWIKVMQNTIRRDRASQTHVPENYLPVLSDGMGGYYYVVCARQGEPPPPDFGKVIYNPAGEPGIYETAADDFLDFVAMNVRAKLDDVRRS